MRPRIYLTNRLYPAAMELLQRYCNIELHEGEHNATEEEIISHLDNKDGIICFIANRMGDAIMEAAPNLKVISTASAGYNHIDIDEATKRGIYVCNTPGGPTEATADLAFGLLMTAGRRIAEADRYMRRGEWKVLSPIMFFGTPVWGKTLGVVGFGQIGRAVARRARGFNMKILYTDVAPAPPTAEQELAARFVSLEELLGESDFVTIHTPVTEATYHLMNDARFAMMKSTAVLVNTSRGGTVDEAALVKALKTGIIAGAGIDVFENEPTGTDNPLFALDNVVVLPHIGSSTEETRVNMAVLAVENLLAALRGEKPQGLLNPTVEHVRSLVHIRMLTI